jgi:hypothetical protein
MKAHMIAEPLASIDDYPTLLVALRARAQALRIPLNHPAVAEVSGLPDRYLPKILGVAGLGQKGKRLGMVSLGPTLAILGVRLLLVEDYEAQRRVKGRLPVSERLASRAIVQVIQRKKLREMGRLGGLARARVIVDKKRRREQLRQAQRRARARRKAEADRSEELGVDEKTIRRAGDQVRTKAAPAPRLGKDGKRYRVPARTRRATPQEAEAAGFKPTGEARVVVATGNVVGKTAATKMETFDAGLEQGRAEVRSEYAELIEQANVLISQMNGRSRPALTA